MSESGPGRREVAYRLFAAEFEDAEFSYSESDEERAPNYVVTPTGARVNRLFAVGVLTEVEDVNPEMVRGRVVDPTGAFVTYAGQYQPDELAFLERADPPTFLALSGKARTFEPDDGDRVFTSVRPESVSEVDAETRDRWVVTAAERTLERIGVMASAIESGLVGDQLRAALEAAGVDERLADGVALALDYYGTTPAYLAALRETAIDALEVVAGERDEVGAIDVAPGEGSAGPEGSRGEGGEAAGGSDAASLATLDLSDAPSPETAAAAAEVDEPEPATDEADSSESGTASEPSTDSEPPADSELESGTGPEADESPGEASQTVESTADRTAPTGEEGETGSSEPAAGEAAGDGSDSDETASNEPTADEAAETSDDLDPGEFELDESERREVEEEYGTEFSTADEIETTDETDPDSGSDSETEPDEPVDATTGDDEIEPEPESESEPETETGPEAETEPNTDPDTEMDADTSAEQDESEEPSPESPSGSDVGTDERSEDVDLVDAVVERIEELDDGDGADRETLVAAVADEYGIDDAAVDEAIQDALMSGRCYEPADGALKSI